MIHFIREGRYCDNWNPRNGLGPHKFLQFSVAYESIHNGHLDVHKDHFQALLTRALLLIVVLPDLVDAILTVLGLHAFLLFIQLLHEFTEDEPIHADIIHNHYLLAITGAKVEMFDLSLILRTLITVQDVIAQDLVLLE
mmetsp:Transcript_40142/g.38644  ORF Transcript_40142/g.38644 Transcript_40142/m.38644 type:complete len:139 (-) Transcript_40142:1495-1911(-)